MQLQMMVLGHLHLQSSFDRSSWDPTAGPVADMEYLLVVDGVWWKT